MKKKALLVCGLILVSGYSFCQPVRGDAVIDMTTASFRSLLPKPPDPIENVYLNDDWLMGNVTLRPDYTLVGVPVKYDLKNNILEIMTTQGIKIAGKSLIKRFEFDNNLEKRIFVDAGTLEIANLTGILEELVNGEIFLYAKPYLKIIPSNYNAALDIGSKTDKFIVEESLFLVKDKNATEVTKAGKKILPYFGDQAPAIQAFVKKNKLSYKNKNSLILIMKEYDRIMKPQG